MIPVYQIAFVCVFALVFYRAGVADEAPGILWAALSIVVSLITWLALSGGTLVMLLGQFALFIGIAVFRVLRDQK